MDKDAWCYWCQKVGNTKLAVELMRISCPNPQCSNFKIVGCCETHVQTRQEKIKLNKAMYCTYCDWHGHAQDFWAFIGKV